jgi:hypothetical protein
MDGLYSDLFRITNQEIVRVIAIWLLSNGTTVVNKKDTRTLISKNTHAAWAKRRDYSANGMVDSNKSEKTFSLSRQISKKEKLTLFFWEIDPRRSVLITHTHRKERRKSPPPHHYFEKKKKLFSIIIFRILSFL